MEPRLAVAEGTDCSSFAAELEGELEPELEQQVQRAVNSYRTAAVEQQVALVGAGSVWKFVLAGRQLLAVHSTVSSPRDGGSESKTERTAHRQHQKSAKAAIAPAPQVRFRVPKQAKSAGRNPCKEVASK